MSSVATAPLAGLCRESDPTTVTAFVADLYAARGMTVDRRGEGRLVVSDGERERRVAVAHPDSGVPPGTDDGWADSVVVPGDSVTVTGDVDVVDAAALRRQLAYAVDRPVARQLLQSRFGWEPNRPDTGDATGANRAENERGGIRSLLPGEGRRGGRASTPLPAPIAGRYGLLFVALFVVAVAGGALALGENIGGGPTFGNTAVMEDTTPTLTPAPTPEPPAGETTPVEDESRSATERTLAPLGDRHSSRQFAALPPGINQSGAIDPMRLASAHRSVLENSSYRLTITNRQFVDGQPAGVYTETIRVVNATRYRADVARRGTLPAPILAIAGTDTYANGSVQYERINDSAIDRESTVAYDRFNRVQARYLDGFLDVRESSIVDNQTGTFYIVTEGNPVYTLRNTTGSVVVTEEGLVRRARWSFDFVDSWAGYSNVSASFRLRVSDVGSTTVREPAWVNRTTGQRGVED